MRMERSAKRPFSSTRIPHVIEHKKSIRTNNQLLQSLSSNNVQFVTRFAVETKLLEFNSVMGGGGKQSTVKKYNKVRR